MLGLSAGTGKFTALLSQTQAALIAVEPVDALREQLSHRFQNVLTLAGTAEAIPLDNASVDAVFCAQAFHCFSNDAALHEIHRVLKPGGKLVVLEFSKPSTPFVSFFYTFYMKIVTPNMGKLFSKNRSAYKYLDESIKKFPEGKNFTGILDKLGYRNTYSKPLSLGICSIYCGEK